jgi:tRNA(His) 5'-end guanylyltransferase
MFEHFFGKSFEKICIPLKSDKNKGYFTQRETYIYNNMLPCSSYYEKCSRQNCRENQNTHFLFGKVFPENHAVCDIMWKKMW